MRPELSAIIIDNFRSRDANRGDSLSSRPAYRTDDSPLPVRVTRRAMELWNLNPSRDT